MAGRLGRVLVGGTDRGAGFALGPRLVVTANHVIRERGDKPVLYVPAGGDAVGVERVQPDVDRDAAVLWLVSEVGEFLPAAAAVREAKWRVESPPPDANDPGLHGTVTTARTTIQKAAGQRVEVVQLEVNEQLGDYGGYSGSAVLDSLGRAALALLVEQKPLRTAVPLGERPAASNVLYAVPIGDVITAFGLSVRPAKPLLFDVGLLPPGMVTRPGLLDETVGQVIEVEGGDTGAGLVLVRGPGGVGKTVLARQVAGDVRVWAEFTGGIVMLRAGQAATADGMARQLQDDLGYRDRDLADVLAGQRLLLIVDDVWDGELLGTLRANLPASIAVLATSRGVSVPRAVAVLVGAVGRDQAIQILARDTPRSEELDRALGRLAETLFGWALLLTLAAAEIHRDDELDWRSDDEYDSHPEVTEQNVLIGRAETLKAEFPNDPTMLDDLERTPEAAAPRSVDVLVRRSLEWLGPEHRARFELLAIYPPGATITRSMLEDLWDTSQGVTRKEMTLLARAGLAQAVRSDELTIELHDLVIAWLHHERGRPDDVRHQPVHQRLAGLCLRADGSPGNLTKDRAEWLAYHLVAAGAWDRLKALPTLRWRSASLVATGSDAAFLAGLDHYGHAALAQAPDAVYHAVRAWLFAAHVRALIGQLPASALVAMALAGNPIAAITQACQHPKAGEAVPAILAAIADRPGVRHLLERAAALAGTIPDDEQRSRALARIAERLAAADPRDPALIDQALAVAGTVPGDRDRGEALACIAGLLAAADPRDPALIDQALAVTETIPTDLDRSGAVAAIAELLAIIGPARAAGLIRQALAVADTIPGDLERSYALKVIAERLAAADPRDPALISQAITVAETIPDIGQCSYALEAIAERLAAADPRDPALISQAITVAETIPRPWDRGWALAGIAQRLAADPRDPALIDQALAVADTIPDDRQRCEALAGIAERLAVIDPARTAALIRRAHTVAETIRNARDRNYALRTIAERLAAADPPNPALINRALTLAEIIPDDQDRGWALAGIAKRLAGADLRDLALIDQDRGRTIAGTARRLPAVAPRDPALIRQAIAVAKTIPGGPGGDLALIVERLAAANPEDPALIDQAIAVAETIPGHENRSRALAGIAERLAVIDPARTAALIREVLAVAETIPDDWVRSGALAGIAGRLAAIDPRDPALIRQAIAVAETIPRDGDRSRAVAAIAECLAAVSSGDPALIDQAIAVAETIPASWERSEALAGIAERLAVIDPARTATLIRQARTVAETIHSDGERSQALGTVAECLAAVSSGDPALIDQAIAVAETIPGDWVHGRALAGIAERLAVIDPARTATLIRQARTIAETSPNDSYVLSTIVERLAAADPPNPVLIDQAIAVARAIPRYRDRGEALAGIAERLAVIDPAWTAALIDQAIAVAETIPASWERSEVLAGIAERLAAADPPSPALINRALTLAETIPDHIQRDSAVTEIAKRLAAADPPSPALINRALTLAETILDNEDRSQAVAALAEGLAAADPSNSALIDRALSVAETIPINNQRSTALARIRALTMSSMLDELSRWRLRPLAASIDLLGVFLGNSHDKAIAESIGHAVIDMAIEASALA